MTISISRYMILALMMLAHLSCGRSDFERAVTEAERGNAEAAITFLTKSIEKNRNLATSYYKRGLIYMQIGEYRLSLSDFNHSIEAEPDAWVYYSRAITNQKMKRERDALKDLDLAVTMNNDDPCLFTSIGMAYHDMDEFIRAIEIFSLAIELDSTMMEAYNGRGNAKMINGDFEGAETDWDKAVEISRRSKQ